VRQWRAVQSCPNGNPPLRQFPGKHLTIRLRQKRYRTGLVRPCKHPKSHFIQLPGAAFYLLLFPLQNILNTRVFQILQTGTQTGNAGHI
jgi:hypothetical protein